MLLLYRISKVKLPINPSEFARQTQHKQTLEIILPLSIPINLLQRCLAFIKRLIKPRQRLEILDIIKLLDQHLKSFLLVCFQHLLATPRTLVVRSAYERDSSELTKESTKLAWDLTEHKTLIGMRYWFMNGKVKWGTGCCSKEARSSTTEEAIGASPGRVTVHIWSRVLSLRDWQTQIALAIE
jgi:hypothetical protein